MASASGFRKGLTNYGDPAFSLFLRTAFIKGAGYSDDALDRPIIGIANTGSAYNPCHGNAAALVDVMAETDGITYLRTTRGAYPVLYDDGEQFEAGGSKVLRSDASDAVTLIGAGVTLHECLLAADQRGGRDR